MFLLLLLSPVAWKDHNGYYNCSKYKEVKEDVNKARQALEKYLFYYQRVRLLEDRLILKMARE